jgi:type I pantothenate kinase
LRSVDVYVSLDEVTEVYLPLSRLLNLYVATTAQLYRVTDTFLGSPAAKVPYVIAIAGSVSGGKSTTARILRALLARWPDHPRVDLVTTDGFLHPNRVLSERGILDRKGFPESYDVRRLVRFLADVKSGQDAVGAPVYSHLHYDIVPGEELIVRRPDIVLVEGLNVLQTAIPSGERAPRVFVSDSSTSRSTSTLAKKSRALVRRSLHAAPTDRLPRSESYFKSYAELSDSAPSPPPVRSGAASTCEPARERAADPRSGASDPEKAPITGSSACSCASSGQGMQNGSRSASSAQISPIACRSSRHRARTPKQHSSSTTA